MRILYLTREISDCPDSLPDHATHALARMAQREGHHVEVVTAPTGVFDAQRLSSNAPPDHRYLVKGVSVTRLAPMDAAAAAERFANWLSTQRFDVLHGVFSHADDWPFSLRADSLPPLIITLTGLPTGSSSARDAAAGAWMRHADAHVVPSAYAASQWQNAWPGSSLRVMPHGVDLLALIRARNTQMADTTAQSPPTLLCVDTGDEQSGVLELLQAFATLDRPDLRLCLICGLGGPSAYSQSVMDAVRSDVRIHPMSAGF